jgi:saccharopine dehydrogenase-like NADP-dependent oxidoreductase
MFRWQLRHAPPTMILGLGFDPGNRKLMAWKLMWHSRHNLMGGAFSRLG